MSSYAYEEWLPQQQSLVARLSYCPTIPDACTSHKGDPAQTMPNADICANLTDVVQITSPEYHISALVGFGRLGEIQIAFRGTNGLDFNNWITNFDSKLADYIHPDTDRVELHTDLRYESEFKRGDLGPVKVHEGFQIAYKQMARRIHAEVSSRIRIRQLVDKEPTDIIISGHSLGGALATLCALHLTQEFKTQATKHSEHGEHNTQAETVPLIALVTFGSPRVGNPAFAGFFSKLVTNSTRITHAHDLVPHLPLQIQGYMHIDHEVWYPNQGTFKLCSADFSTIVQAHTRI